MLDSESTTSTLVAVVTESVAACSVFLLTAALEERMLVACRSATMVILTDWPTHADMIEKLGTLKKLGALKKLRR